MREGSGDAKSDDHSWAMPKGVLKQLEMMLTEDGDECGEKDGASLGVGESGHHGPFITKRLGIRASQIYPLQISLRLTPRSRTLLSSPHQRNSPMVASAPADRGHERRRDKGRGKEHC